MSEPSDFEGIELPPELAELDAELSSIRYEERPSFGPELHAELVREWATSVPYRRAPVRQLLAAGIAGLLMIGVGVPSARASLVRLVTAFQSPSNEAVDSPSPPSPGALLLEPLVSDPSPSLSAEWPPASLAQPGPDPIPQGASGGDAASGPEASFPELLDRARAEARVRDGYPMELQQAGVGGTVGLLLWVDSTGAVEFASVGSTSGVALLDSAALRVAPDFAFEPARRWGRSVATWVEFDVRFQAPPLDMGPGDGEEPTEGEGFPAVDPVSVPHVPELNDPMAGSPWPESPALPVREGARGGELLRAAIADDRLVSRLGPIQAILEGDPPRGVAPTRWRADVADALEAAMVRDPDNPAPPLALARLRRKQGLRTEARMLLERGLQRGMRQADGGSPEVMADLHYERGTLLREGYLAVSGLGRVMAESLDPAACPSARSSGGAVSGVASVDRLIAWNYLCPAQLHGVLAEAFELTERGAQVDLALMTASFRSAVEASPAHVGANVELLLLLADENRWEEMLSAARSFIRASEGHPYGHLLAGLALQRQGRTDEAAEEMDSALRRLPSEEAERIQDVSAILGEAEADEYWSVSGAERDRWVEWYWIGQDPILSTRVNERQVEHLARVAHAMFRFGTTTGDPSRVWIRYGRPEAIRVFGEGSGLRTEFWDYGLGGPDVTFRRPSSSADMDLTSEGQAYLDELRQVFPQRYGDDARVVDALAGQVGRFLGSAEGEVEVDVHTRVPADLTRSARGPLQLGVFLLNEEGRTRSVQRRQVPPRPEPLSMRLPTDAASATVVVEFFDPTTGRAAVLRRSLTHEASVGGVSVSDLLLHEAFPAGSVLPPRGSTEIHALTMESPVTSGAVAATFELYGLANKVAWYRVRAEVRRSSDGTVFDVPLRPSDQSEFREAWDRWAPSGRVALESLTLDLGGLPAGAYTLRVVTDLPDMGMPLVVEKSLTLG